MKSERKLSDLNVKPFLHTPASPDTLACYVKPVFYLKVKWL